MVRLAIIAPDNNEWDFNILPMLKIGKWEKKLIISFGWLIFNFEIEYIRKINDN